MSEEGNISAIKTGDYRATDEERRTRAEQLLEQAKATEARLRAEGRLMNVEHNGRQWTVSRTDYFDRRTAPRAGWNPQTKKARKEK